MLEETDYQRLSRRIRELEDALALSTTSKDQAYKERNALVALLSKIFPSCLSVHDINDKDWEDDWRWIVFIELPTGQCSWHIHKSEFDAGNFDHLPIIENMKWDGHTTEEKYERIKRYQNVR